MAVVRRPTSFPRIGGVLSPCRGGRCRRTTPPFIASARFYASPMLLPTPRLRRKQGGSALKSRSARGSIKMEFDARPQVRGNEIPDAGGQYDLPQRRQLGKEGKARGGNVRPAEFQRFEPGQVGEGGEKTIVDGGAPGPED